MGSWGENRVIVLKKNNVTTNLKSSSSFREHNLVIYETPLGKSETGLTCGGGADNLRMLCRDCRKLVSEVRNQTPRTRVNAVGLPNQKLQEFEIEVFL